MSKLNDHVFERFVGNASTSAWRQKRFLGRNVSVAVYRHKSNGSLLLQLESNANPVMGVAPIKMSRERFDEIFYDLLTEGDFRAMQLALELFDCRTSWSEPDASHYEQMIT